MLRVCSWSVQPAKENELSSRYNRLDNSTWSSLIRARRHAAKPNKSTLVITDAKAAGNSCMPCLFGEKWAVHHEQRLLWHGSLEPLGTGRVWTGEIEGSEKSGQVLSLNKSINRAPMRVWPDSNVRTCSRDAGRQSRHLLQLPCHLWRPLTMCSANARMPDLGRLKSSQSKLMRSAITSKAQRCWQNTLPRDCADCLVRPPTRS